MKKEQFLDFEPHLKPTEKIFKGMPLEVEGFDNRVYPWLYRIAHKLWDEKAQIIPEGDLPHEGPAFIIATHAKNESTVLLPWLTTKIVNRPIQVAAKDTLLNTKLVDRPNVLKRTNKAENAKASLSEKIFSGPARAANSFGLDRGGDNREVFKLMGDIFNAGHLIGWFLQETRSEEDDLQHPMEGAAMVMRMFPKIDTYLVSMTNTKLRGNNGRPPRSPIIRISNPFNYEEMTKEKPLRRNEVTKELTLKMANLLIKDIPKVKLPNGESLKKVNDKLIFESIIAKSSNNT